MHESDRRGDGDDDQDGRPWRDPTSFSILWFYFILFYFIPLIVPVPGYVYRKDWAGVMRWHRVDRRRHRRMRMALAGGGGRRGPRGGGWVGRGPPPPPPPRPGSTCRLAPGARATLRAFRGTKNRPGVLRSSWRGSLSMTGTIGNGKRRCGGFSGWEYYVLCTETARPGPCPPGPRPRVTGRGIFSRSVWTTTTFDCESSLDNGLHTPVCGMEPCAAPFTFTDV
jgi:hypothetical protein